MKLVTLSGGIGNQMFQYAFYLKMRSLDPHTYIHLKKIKDAGEHNGYELERVFGICIPSGEYWITRLLLLPGIGSILKHLLFRKKYRERVYYSFRDNKEVFSNRFPKSSHLVGYWQSEKYFEDILPQIRETFRFNERRLNSFTRELAKELAEVPSSVSVHIRRGDYLTPHYFDNYGNICTDEYYSKAINYMKKQTDTPRFYIFTDDVEWAKEHFISDTTVIVEWNIGHESWQDMYLMSLCKHHIIANSSFSWWAAWLNPNPAKIVIAPARWINTQDALEACPEMWIRI